MKTPIIFGRNFTGKSQDRESCYLYSDPILFLNVFLYERQTINNRLLTNLNVIACPCWEAAAEMYPNNYLQVSMALYLKGRNRSWDHRHIFHPQWSMIHINKMIMLWTYLIDLTIINCSWIFSLDGVLKSLTLQTLGSHHIAKGLSPSQSMADSWSCKGSFSSFLSFPGS